MNSANKLLVKRGPARFIIFHTSLSFLQHLLIGLPQRHGSLTVASPSHRGSSTAYKTHSRPLRLRLWPPQRAQYRHRQELQTKNRVRRCRNTPARSRRESRRRRRSGANKKAKGPKWRKSARPRQICERRLEVLYQQRPPANIHLPRPPPEYATTQTTMACSLEVNARHLRPSRLGACPGRRAE